MMNNAIKTGSTVTLTDSFFYPTLANVICEVVDSRLQNGIYSFSVAPLSAVGVDWSRKVEGLTADELRAV